MTRIDDSKTVEWNLANMAGSGTGSSTDPELVAKVTKTETKVASLESQVASIDTTPQTLELDGTTLKISKGNSVNLPTGGGASYDDTELKNRVSKLEAKEDKDTVYDDSDLKQRVTALESKTDKDTVYDDTEIKKRISDLETKEDKDTVYDDTELKQRVTTLESKVDKDEQTLSIEGRTISISNGNSIELPEDANTVYDDTDLKQRVTALETKDDNDKQTLAIDGNTLSISNGNSVTLPANGASYDDSGLKARISALETKTDNDTVYDDTELRNKVNALEAKADKDEQTLTLDRKVLSITGGNNVTLPDGNTRDLTTDSLVAQPENRILEAYKTPISVLTGKKILFVGDSLTEVNYRTSRGYVESLKADKGIEAINNGSSGYGYSTKDESFMGADRDSCDAFVIFLGINDFGNVSGFKLPLDVVLKTAKRLLSKACLQAGNRPIGVILPMQNLNTLNEKVGAGGYSLKQLVDGIKATVKEVSAKFNRAIPVLDLYSLDPLDVTKHQASDAEYLNNYFTQNKVADKEFLHPNDAGWKLITPYISYWLENTFDFQAKRPDAKTLQVVERADGNLEINTTTTPIKYDSTESNAYNRNKFRIPTFGDGSNIYNLRSPYSDNKTKYKLVITVNNDFTFDTDYHPVATEYYQQFFYFDVDSITTNPTEYLANNNVQSVMTARSCDEKEAKYILGLVRLYKNYLDNKLFTPEEQSTYKLLNTSNVPVPMKVVIEKR